jgi:hypothetical protein
MIRSTRSTSLLVVFGLFISTAPAFADCAWVLWNDEVRLDYATQAESRLWHTIASATRKSECDARLRQEIERVTNPDNRPKEVVFRVQGDAVQVMHFRSDKPNDKVVGVQTFRFVCLPEKVDPRGPKGQGPR